MADEPARPASRGKRHDARVGRAETARDEAESSRNAAHAKTRETEEKLALLVARVRDYAILMLDPDGNITTWNEGAERIKGYKASEIIGRHVSTFYTPEDVQAGLPEKLLGIARREGRVENEGWRVRKDGSRFWADVIITALCSDDGELRGFGKVTRDLSERRAAEDMRESIRESEERFSLLVSRVKDYAIFILDPHGNVASWNAGAQRIKGYTEAEIVGRHISTFYPPEAVAAGHPQEMLRRAVAEGSVEEEAWRVRKDGTKFWADVIITALHNDDGKLVGFAKVTRDLSERREMELALSELSGRLMQTQDDERRRLARELHDSTSPLLTGLVAKLYAAKQRLSNRDDPMAMLIEEALMNAEATTTVVRTVASLLHPPLLDESGLVASLKWYLAAFVKRTDVKIESVFPPSMGRLDRDTELALFRTVQESVATIMRQANSRRIKIKLTVANEILDLAIEGDGAGINPEVLHELRSGRGEGGVAYFGMRERMRQMGGKLDFRYAAGQTIVSATLPLHEHR